jgi:hypothetical protein
MGSTNTLPLGEVRAVKAAGLRVPENATPEQRELADRTQQRIIDVMEERVHFQMATPVLKAATTLREEVCGKVADKHELTGKDGERLQVSININRGER